MFFKIGISFHAISNPLKNVQSDSYSADRQRSDRSVESSQLRVPLYTADTTGSKGETPLGSSLPSLA